MQGFPRGGRKIPQDGEVDVQYRPRTAVKGQIVADFIAEYTQSEDKGVEGQKL